MNQPRDLTARQAVRLKASLIVFLILLFSSMARAQSQAIESSGDILLFALPAATLGGSLIAGDEVGTVQFAKGLITNQVVTIGLKYLTTKKRPYNNGDRAFPSGHTSTTFQSASFIQRRYGWKYGLPAYTLAGFTAFSRINAQKHDGWDVLAGAAVGIGSSYLFTTPYMEEHLELSFSSGAEGYALGVRYKF